MIAWLLAWWKRHRRTEEPGIPWRQDFTAPVKITPMSRDEMAAKYPGALPRFAPMTDEERADLDRILRSPNAADELLNGSITGRHEPDLITVDDLAAHPSIEIRGGLVFYDEVTDEEPHPGIIEGMRRCIEIDRDRMQWLSTQIDDASTPLTVETLTRLYEQEIVPTRIELDAQRSEAISRWNERYDDAYAANDQEILVTPEEWDELRSLHGWMIDAPPIHMVWDKGVQPRWGGIPIRVIDPEETP